MVAAEAEGERGVRGDTEDEDLKKAFEEWKSKPYALTVPLRLVGLRGSVPPAWLKVGRHIASHAGRAVAQIRQLILSWHCVTGVHDESGKECEGISGVQREFE